MPDSAPDATKEEPAADASATPLAPLARFAPLPPLLCALTSAHLAAYAEEGSRQMPGIVSGKFRSMLVDIFGRSYPEREFFMVDRDAVTRYKARVHRNVARVGERIEQMLRNVAVAA